MDLEHVVMVRPDTAYMTLTSVVQIVDNLNSHRYISDIAHQMALLCIRSLTNVIFQQYNPIKNVARCILKIFRYTTKGIRLLH